jgi:hypothetical protein
VKSRYNLLAQIQTGVRVYCSSDKYVLVRFKLGIAIISVIFTSGSYRQPTMQLNLNCNNFWNDSVYKKKGGSDLEKGILKGRRDQPVQNHTGVRVKCFSNQYF